MVSHDNHMFAWTIVMNVSKISKQMNLPILPILPILGIPSHSQGNSWILFPKCDHRRENFEAVHCFSIWHIRDISYWQICQRTCIKIPLKGLLHPVDPISSLILHINRQKYIFIIFWIDFRWIPNWTYSSELTRMSQVYQVLAMQMKYVIYFGNCKKYFNRML